MKATAPRLLDAVISITIWTLLVGVSSSMAVASSPKAVLVSGAGGQTGQALFRKLLALPDEFEPFGMVRTEASKEALVDSGIPDSAILVTDITDEEAVRQAVQTASQRNGKLAALCICSSAKPVPTEKVNPENGRPVFGFAPGGEPEQVDWIGQKNQIDAVLAEADSSCHVVVCSTMGGTNPDHPLNNIGRTTNPDGTTSGGMIVQWKRKAEVYLMEKAAASDSLTCTIVHPGGLINEDGGERELVVGVDDRMDGTESRTVPREDVAQVMLEAIRYPKQYGGRSFDVRAKPVGEGTPTSNFEGLLDVLQGKDCDYTLGATM